MRERTIDLVLGGATLLDGSVADVRIADGTIIRVGPVGATPPNADDRYLDLTGHLLSPAAVEPHAHL
ncbi:MAG: hydrolase, partial [Ilumatobacteraceae bacterium]